MDFADTFAGKSGSPGIGLHEGVIANAPAGIEDEVKVIIPSFDLRQIWGPARWQPRINEGTFELPSRGDPCLVALTAEGTVWIASWWSGAAGIDPPPPVIPDPPAPGAFESVISNGALGNLTVTGLNWAGANTLLTLDIEASGERPIKVVAAFTLSATSGHSVKASLKVDGVEVTGLNNGLLYWQGTSPLTQELSYVIEDPPAETLTIDLVFFGTTNPGGTIFRDTTDNHARMYAYELFTEEPA